MSGHVVYACHCLNITIHLATKYTLDSLDKIKNDTIVKEPFPGWEFDLGMGGIVIEFNTLIQSSTSQSHWNTVKCLNCNSGNIYSVTKANNVIIHPDAICGKAYEDLKKKTNYSKTFSINLDDSMMEDIIPMPSPKEDIPSALVSTHKKIQSILDQSIKQMRIESKVRIEQFKKQEEKRLEASIAYAMDENNRLWTKIVKVTSKVDKTEVKHQTTKRKEEKEKNTTNVNHVCFAPELNNHQSEEQQHPKSLRRTSFNLDEATIGKLCNVNLDKQMPLLNKDLDNIQEENDDNNEEEEDIFNLDEEFSEEEENEATDNEEEEEELNKEEVGENHLPLSTSLKKSISQIDKKFSWIKKKRNTNKYLPQDFDIKNNSKKETSNDNEPVTIYATSVPVAIHYPLNNDKEEGNDTTNTSMNETKRGNDILAFSFANYNNASFSDKLLSDQFTVAPRRRKSLMASSSMIRPQLDTVVGKSLDTRGLLKKKATVIESNYTSDDDFDSKLPPHIWALIDKDEE
ncbi:uncharacterized protein BX663DRAFT_519841 [Cokeromyces recurvatus]|uniref:uncharacterized protein n=1 Tax=Cokeromyces recurvatus TaxID=90255 RepID=UPI0022200F42|nr:uncharacterized protein BX663DRAFT_519841 [Cokeromyces recurvatus]KAI7899892.1 hypothetical protein BX663DRAFT_519841 [Cokeromyces recurvatus]